MTVEKKDLVSAYDLAMGERKFLHDLSNKLLVVQGMSKTVLKKIESNEAMTEKELNRLMKVVKASDAMIELLQRRREVVHEECKIIGSQVEQQPEQA
ncbi:MAG: hypothetical protein CME63_00540 [Halobacteriovoraceae bacterium]|nr:hypothetical protein [Halobacteriovoraceae bacterium]MBC96212.1 hypothetical protein [Halobacteriovoraceae bacterium]